MNIGSSSAHAPKDIISYLSSFEDGTLVSLYVDEFTVLTVFRSLRGLAKQYVMNMVLCSSAIPKAAISQWSLSSASAHHKAAMHKLSTLKIIETVNNDQMIKLNDSFRTCLQKVIFGDSSKDMLYVESEPKATPQRIAKHAKSRWETILNILVGIGDEKQFGDNLKMRATIPLLVKVGLISKNEKTQKWQLTGQGFKFLFVDIHSQIWQIIIAYLEGVEARKLNKKSVLMFLFKLSFLTLNRAFSSQHLGDDEKCVVADLCGMAYCFSVNRVRFCFTRRH